MLYDLVSPATVAGLVFNTASLVPSSDFTELKALLVCCHPLPATSIAMKVEGLPSITIKGEIGMRDLVSHLIDVHGRRRIAIIRGE